MRANRVRVGLAVGFLAVVLSAGPAVAQVAGCSFSDCAPQSPQTPTTTVTGGAQGTTATTVASGAVLPTSEESPSTTVAAAPVVAQAPTIEAVAESGPSGTLPFTGSDIVGLVVIGVAALGLGTLLVRRSRTRSESAS